MACALNGLALGGGLEVALACHYRVAANDNPKIQFGLPEAKIGLLPGAGGTQRLPRLIGVQEALPLILEGKSFDADKAMKMGVVQELAPGDETCRTAKAWVRANPASPSALGRERASRCPAASRTNRRAPAR